MKAARAPSGTEKPKKQVYCTPRWLVQRLVEDEHICLDVCGSPTRPTLLPFHVMLPITTTLEGETVHARDRPAVRALMNQWEDGFPRAVIGDGLKLPWGEWPLRGRSVFQNPVYEDQGTWIARAVYHCRNSDVPSTSLVQVSTTAAWFWEIAAMYCQIDLFDGRIAFEDELTGEPVKGADFDVCLVHARLGFEGRGTWRYRSAKTGRLLELPRGAFHPRLPGL